MRLATIVIPVLTLSATHVLGDDTDIPTAYWESSQLSAQKEEAKNPTEELEQTLSVLRHNADLALTRGPYSVMYKQDIPPSGDKHDYMSFSRYWWPNPNTADGLPYVRHDGRVNRRLRQRGDRDQIGMLFEDIETLSLAYYFLDNEQYARHALQLIRTWFLDPETKMNPHLKYGQAVPGRAEGRGVGIIDTRGSIILLDAVELLAANDAVPEETMRQLRDWFTDYLEWLRTSDLGQEEARAENNHGSWYAAQASRIALFVGQDEIAEDIVRQVQNERIPAQFREDGSQPEELERTQSLHYSCFNLDALSVVARVGERLGINLWNAADTRKSLQPGIDFLLPYLTGESVWNYPQIQEFSLSRGSIQFLRMASVRYGNSVYLEPIAMQRHRHPESPYAELLFAKKKR